MIEILLIIISVLLAMLYMGKYKRPKNYPPGPTPLPFIGNTFQIPKGHFHDVIEMWAKKYGPVIGFSIFDDNFVAVSGVKDVLAALRKEEFQSRPSSFVAREGTFGKNLGIFFSSGEQWHSSRKFTLKHLKAFGRNESENLISNEIDRLMDTIKDNCTIQGTGVFGLSAVNVIWSIIASQRLDTNDEKSNEFLKNLQYSMRNGNPSGAEISNIFPILRHLSPTKQIISSVRREIQNYIRNTIHEHRKILDKDNPIDLFDHYLVEMEKNENTPNSYFSEEDLIVIGTELFAAGAESTSNSVEFVLLYMILHPDAQRKMQEELDRVLGRARKPMLGDKAELHYTMAVITEVERLNGIAPITPMHYSTQDTTFSGYFIPKGTQININLHSLGTDPNYWDKPEEFIPERFLDDNGKFTKSQILHPFGLGQRICIGEMLARNSIFLFTTTFFEKYSISLPHGEPKPSTDPLPGFTIAPKPFKMHIKSRY